MIEVEITTNDVGPVRVTAESYEDCIGQYVAYRGGAPDRMTVQYVGELDESLPWETTVNGEVIDTP